MLVHQTWETEAVASDTVKLTDRLVSNTSVAGTVHSGVRLDSLGQLFTFQAEGGTSAVIGEWLVSGTPADFYVQRTITSGTLEVDPGAGFLQLNTTRSYDNQKASVGVKTTVVFFEISSDVSGVPIVATATHTYVSHRDVDI